MEALVMRKLHAANQWQYAMSASLESSDNVARTALQALAAVLGGTQSLHTNSMDEALALPTEDAVTIALRTQQIIAEETGVVHTADPLGGGFLVELPGLAGGPDGEVDVC